MVAVDRKLSKDALSRLKKVAVREFAPDVLVYSHVYVYLERNEKFVLVKAPFQYFSEAELNKLRSFRHLYVSEDELAFDRLRKFGAAIRNTLSLAEKIVMRSDRSEEEIVIELPAWELAPDVRKACAEIWQASEEIEFESLGVLLDEIFGKLPEELLRARFDLSVAEAEQALRRANIAVFLALQMGHCHRGFLRQMRTRLVAGAANGSIDIACTSAAQELIERAGSNGLRLDSLKSARHPFCRRIAESLESRTEEAA